MHAWLEATLAKLSRKSDTAAAIRYALLRWPALIRYVDDGALEIDNNAAERALRVVALGRKNFLCAGSNAGGERAAAIYSLLGSALCRARHRADHAELPTMPNDSCMLLSRGLGVGQWPSVDEHSRSIVRKIYSVLRNVSN
jgi:hypothetical protein